jgi:hypothetical protein
MEMAIAQHFQCLRRFHQFRKHQHYQWLGVSMHQRLVDSLRDLMAALNAMLEREGQHPVTLVEIQSMFGDGTLKLVQRALRAIGGTRTALLIWSLTFSPSTSRMPLGARAHSPA